MRSIFLLPLLAACTPEHLPDVTIYDATMPEFYVWSADYVLGLVNGYAVLEMETDSGTIEETVELHGGMIGLAAGLSFAIDGHAEITLPEPMSARDLDGAWHGVSYRGTALLGIEGGVLWRKHMRLNYVQVGVGVNAGALEFEWLNLGPRGE